MDSSLVCIVCNASWLWCASGQHASWLSINRLISFRFFSSSVYFCGFPVHGCAGCLCSDCWHWSALCSGRHPSSLPSGGTDRVHHRFFLSYIGARNESQGIIFSVADIGHACFAQDRCEECARSPRPLMRNALLCPFSFVHSLWSITPGAMVFSRKSVMR